jgi:hypothetical protein
MKQERKQHMLLVKYLTIINIHMTGNTQEAKMFWHVHVNTVGMKIHPCIAQPHMSLSEM